jgi:uncharacterized membrane protein
MQQNKYKYLKTIFFILSVLFISPILLHETYEYDEGIILCGADRVLHGELPYRDFWTMYSPGQYYILSILFRLIGRSLLTERLFDSNSRLTPEHRKSGHFRS